MKKKSAFIIIISCMIFSWFLFVVRGIAIQLDIDSKNPKVVGKNIVDYPPVVDVSKYSTKPVTIENMDNLFYMITLDYNCGLDHKAMGGLLGKEIREKVPNYAEYCDTILSSCMGTSVPGGPAREPLSWHIGNVIHMMQGLNSDYVDELEGIAAQICNTNESRLGDSKISKDEFLVMNFLNELVYPVKSSANSIYGDKTIDGKTISGVNFDGNHPIFKALSSITVYKQGDKSFCNIGYAGIIGVNAAFNDDKIFATSLQTNFDNPGTVYYSKNSTAFELRYIMENESKVDDSIEHMVDKNYEYYKDNIIFFSDTENSKVLENDLGIQRNELKRVGITNKRGVRTADSELNTSETWGVRNSIAAVNSFMLNGDKDIMKKYNNAQRFESLKKLSTDMKSPCDFEDMKEIMSFTHSDNNASVGNAVDGSIYNGETIQSIIFKPADMRLEVAFTPSVGDIPSKPNFVSVPIDFK